MTYLKKHLWLPVKFWLTRKRLAAEMGVRPKDEIWERISREKAYFLEAERKDDDILMDQVAERIKILEWVTKNITTEELNNLEYGSHN